MRREYLITIVLIALTLGLYWQVGRFEFIGYDDPSYVSENPVVAQGFTQRSVAWALQETSVGNYHPLTSLSHILDVELFGLNPGAHHLVNAALHACNVVLLFLFLRLATGATWRSAFVAAIFALHPLRVESVAWISERKDVLSGFFFMLTLLTYAFYVRESGARKHRRLAWYLAALLSSALGLASKPMLVTLPFLLLLLDYWPFARADLRSIRSWRWPVIEKIPFFLLALVFSLLTFRAQKSWGAMQMTEPIGTADRLVNAAVSYWAYVQKFFLPVNLAPIYPHPSAGYAGLQPTPIWWGLCLGTAFLVVCAGAFWVSRRRPWVFTGWFWYAGLLVPVIGIIQVGEQAMADRYTYLPLIGFTVVLTWGATEVAQRWRVPTGVLAAIAGVAVVVCGLLTYKQIGLWKDTVSLFAHTLRVTGPNPSAHFALGLGLERRGEVAGAIEQYHQSIALFSRYRNSYYNLGHLYKRQQEWSQAEAYFRQVVEIEPTHLGGILNVGHMLQQQGKTAEAVTWYERALQLDSGSVEALNNLAWILAIDSDPALRDPARAVELSLRACQASSYSIPTIIGTLAVAYSEAGLFHEAIQTAERACQVAQAVGDLTALETNRKLLERYRAGKKYTDPE